MALVLHDVIDLGGEPARQLSPRQLHHARRLPRPRGPISENLLWHLTQRSPSTLTSSVDLPADALTDDDLHLALYCIYELSYRGLPGVDDGWEHSPHLVAERLRLEAAFEQALLAQAWPRGAYAEAGVHALLRDLASDDGPSLANYLEISGSLDQLREFLVHRSIYQLKEADPHSWGLPRLAGRAKHALVHIQMDEYGNGEMGASHDELFARAMEAVDLDPSYAAYIDHVPGSTLATGNLISLLGINRRWRGALIGHLAMFELTSPASMQTLVSASQRLGAPDDLIRFFAVHVDDDQDHGQVATTELVDGFLEEEPEQALRVAFGASALSVTEAAFTGHILGSWWEGRTSLR